MAILTTLPLKTADGRPLMHKFYRQEGEPAGLLVTFPGAHYLIDAPLLYYPAELLGAAGWDTLALCYGFQTAMTPFGPEALPDLLQECQQALRGALAARRYPRIGLVGKSLGAGLVAYLCRQESALAEARAAFLTPPLGSPMFDPLFQELPGPALVAIGTADRFYDAAALQALQAARPFELLVVPGADHSMDVEGDLGASLEAVRRVVEGVVGFMEAG